MTTPFLENRRIGTESTPFINPWQVFQEGDLTIVHKNMPLTGFFPILKDGIWQSPQTAIGVQGIQVGRMNIVGARLRSLGKEQRGVPSGDQIIFAPITPSKLLVGVVDGITPLYTPEAYFPDQASQLFPPNDLATYQKLSGETLEKVEISPDSYAAILFAKMFPLSGQFQTLKEKKNLSAKDVLLAVNEYFADVSFKAFALDKKIPEHLPGAVASLALIDFNQKIVSTAHIGDSAMGFDRWFPQWEFEFGYSQEFQSLSEDQNGPFDLELFKKVTLAGIPWHSLEARDSLVNSYQRKINTKGGVGVLNGQLNPDLIIEHTIPLAEVFTLLFYTDGVNARDGKAVLHNAYRLMQTGDPTFLEKLRQMAVKANLRPIKRDDDETILAICFADSVHCYTRDWLGKDKYLEQGSWLGQVRFNEWVFDPQANTLKPIYYNDVNIITQ